MLSAIRDNYRYISCETKIETSPFLKSLPVRKSPKSVRADIYIKKKKWVKDVFIRRGYGWIEFLWRDVGRKASIPRERNSMS